MDDVVAGIGPRLKALRIERDLTLSVLAEATGISVSTLSRLESGQRRASLELLLPIASTYRIPLDDLVREPVRDPRIKQVRNTNGRMTSIPLTRQPGNLQAYKIIIEPDPDQVQQQRTHEGYEWFYVLAGRVRLLLGEQDVMLTAGEAVEFNTRIPHWFGAAGKEPAELLSLFGRQGERMHLRT
ncbi:helix-turn-helix domain-containing protein [Rhodococcus sp. NPDC058521]|uniref:helix-turn-helix domain-containing protein n=1 Tax=Rhodococcus sp. NPDC058521 TaxID=3346536 RepID=UPI003646EE1C